MPQHTESSAKITLTPELEAYIQAQVEKQVAEALKLKGLDVTKTKRVAIIASKGTLDMAYPPLILATTAAAMDMEAAIFFSLYGLDIVKKKTYNNLQVPSLANPAMWVPLPNIIGMLPGMTAMVSWMMKGWMKKGGMPTIPDLLEMAQENGVRLIACQMSLEVMGCKPTDMLNGLEYAGAGMFLDYAADADVTLYV